LATVDTVRIVEGAEVLALHTRNFDRGAQIELAAHIQALIDHKRRGRAHRAMDRLHHAAPSAAQLFTLAAERGVNLAVLTRGLIDLLDTHGAAALENALLAALRENAAHLGAVRRFVDQHRARRGQPPPIPVALPDDPRIRALTVRAHNLSDYEQLAREGTDERPDDEQDAD